MKKKSLPMKKALRAALLVLLLSVVGMTKMYASYDFSAVCETGQTLYYNITDVENHYVELTCPGTPEYGITWSGYTKPTGDIILPESVQYDGETYSVTSIGDYALISCSGLTTIEIPNSVTSIGYAAFDHCSGLPTIEIPNSVTSIGDAAFFCCSGLTSIEIPNSVTSIGIKVFSFCIGLGQIIVASGNPVYDSRENCNAIIKTNFNEVVEGCKNTVIPSSVTSIGSYAFYDKGLTSIEIPNSVTSIGYAAFYGCSGLTSIEIPNSVTTIVSNAFGFCRGLTSIEIPNSVTSIGSYAFRYCSGLTSIEISSSATSIGDHAFEYCSGLTSITSFAETPPTLGFNVFVNVNKSIPIYVTCESVEAYTTPYYWGGFSNFIGLCGGTVTVATNPEEGGTVIGEGYYEGGNTCTITASANTGYYFMNWTENGTVVSYDASYSFTVIGDRDLVANFAEGNMIGDGGTATNSYLPSCSWYPYSFTQQIYTADEIGIAGTINRIAFYNGGVETTRTYDFYLVATDKTSFTNSTDWVSVFEADKMFSGQVTMVTNDWTIIEFDTPFEYDGTSNIILVADDNTSSYSSNIACRVFNADGNQAIRVYGSTNYNPSSPSSYSGTLMNMKNQILLGIIPSTVEQTVTLSLGWNWWSSYIELSDIDGLSLLENAIGIPNVRIESKDGDYVRSKVRNGRTVWVGALTSINNEEMYKINTKETCTATLEGQAADPANHPITINRGWNWIGFPCDHSVSVSEAMSGFSPKKNDMIKGKDGSATYSNGTWSGTLNTLEPGQGYMYGSKSNAPKTLVFQTGNRGEATLANITPENNVFQPVDDFADNMTVIAVVELDGEELRSDNYELAAFAGDECRGSVKLMYVEPVNRYVAFLTVFGDEAEDLHFVLTDGATSDLSADHLTYTIDGIEGTLDEPVVLRFGATDVNENAAVNVRVYPNPSDGIFNLEGSNIRKVEVFNALGQPVYSMETENGSLKLDLTSRAAGIYLIRVVTSDGIWSHQLMKR